MTDELRERDIRRVHPRRLEIASGDICRSYSLDEISAGHPVRGLFEYASESWICTGMRGANITDSGQTEFEAYRLTPVNAFKDEVVTWKARTGTSEAKAAAEADPDGLYHGVLVRHGRMKAVLRGPPTIFVAREVTKRRKQQPPASNPEPNAVADPQEAATLDAESAPATVEADCDDAPGSDLAPVNVPCSRLNSESGDIHLSYSADRIGMGQPVRRPFKFDRSFWVCTGISGLRSAGLEHEAYRLVPDSLFIGQALTYHEKTGTAEGAEAARNDPDGFYHGMKVKFASAAFVLCGPPIIFAAQPVDPNHPAQPEQLALF